MFVHFYKVQEQFSFVVKSPNLCIIQGILLFEEFTFAMTIVEFLSNVLQIKPTGIALLLTFICTDSQLTDDKLTFPKIPPLSFCTSENAILARKLERET